MARGIPNVRQIVATRQASATSAIEFQAFLEQVVAQWTDAQLVLVLDNATYHKTAAVRAWLAAHTDWVSVLWLPTYSPQLNLTERVWRFVKIKLACHRYWNDLPSLCAAAHIVLD